MMRTNPTGSSVPARGARPQQRNRLANLSRTPSEVPNGSESGTTLAALLTDWASWQRAAGLSERTIRERAGAVTRLAESSTHDALKIDRLDVVRFLGRRGLGQSTRATYHATLTAWFRWCVTSGLRTDDPMYSMDAPRRPKGAPQPITSVQAVALRSSVSRARTRAMVTLMMFAGLRSHEVAKFRGEDIDLEANTLRVTGKGGKTAVLPLHREIAALAPSFPTRGWWFAGYEGLDKPITGQAVSTAVGRAMRRAGFDGHAHQLRHWFGSALVASGVDLRTVQELMRHEYLNTTQIYTQVPDGARRAGIDSLTLVSP